MSPHTSMREWADLITFQSNIAERWLLRGQESEDPFAKFFFYFTAFNALYFLWAHVDHFPDKDGKLEGETKQISHLTHKFSEHQIQRVLEELAPQIVYFSQRDSIQRMSNRMFSNLIRGEQAEGKKWQRGLHPNRSPSARLESLAQILYLIRCNLVHGSKVDQGDDEEIIEKSLEPLRCLIRESLVLTKQANSE